MSRSDLGALVLACALAVPGCGGGGATTPGAPSTPTPSSPATLTLMTPYVSSADVAAIREAFSTSAAAPWGFAHNGIDFFPTGDLRPFQAACAGTVEAVEPRANEITGNWQVNLRIRFDATFVVEYAFEPFSPSQADGQLQREALTVSAGGRVTSGQSLGRLVSRGNGAHVHFSVFRNGVAVCPEPYFTADARNSVMALVQRDGPSWNMCY